MNAQQRLLHTVLRNRRGEHCGVYAVCSSDEAVLRASFAHAQESGCLLLIESTSNQVNQFGGYTGMTPSSFVTMVHSVSATVGFPQEQLLIGADHLGPHTWRHLPEVQAMEHADKLVTDCVLAGYKKLHLDASMPLADDTAEGRHSLTDEVVASRCARLCKTAEIAWRSMGSSEEPPLYIIGTEVPSPGGQESASLHTVTSANNVNRTIAENKNAFYAQGLEAAWSRVIGVVVNPGVEFGDDTIHEYSSELVSDLKQAIEGIEGIVFEAHSTDYQSELALKSLVKDHFCILKVGPWLTFVQREALFALELLEKELYSDSSVLVSNFRATLEQVMLEDPAHWQSYYQGCNSQQRLKRSFSFSDRNRYYLSDARVQEAKARLFRNLRQRHIPLSILSQYLPEEYRLVRQGKISVDPASIVENRIRSVLGCYSGACSI